MQAAFSYLADRAEFVRGSTFFFSSLYTLNLQRVSFFYFRWFWFWFWLVVVFGKGIRLNVFARLVGQENGMLEPERLPISLLIEIRWNGIGLAEF